MQRTFVTSLAEDYERWATDAAYRHLLSSFLSSAEDCQTLFITIRCYHRAERRDHAAVSDELLQQAALDEL